MKELQYENALLDILDQLKSNVTVKGLTPNEKRIRDIALSVLTAEHVERYQVLFKY